jgi:hypothetical protein
LKSRYLECLCGRTIDSCVLEAAIYLALVFLTKALLNFAKLELKNAYFCWKSAKIAEKVITPAFYPSGCGRTNSSAFDVWIIRKGP